MDIIKDVINSNINFIKVTSLIYPVFLYISFNFYQLKYRNILYFFYTIKVQFI